MKNWTIIFFALFTTCLVAGCEDGGNQDNTGTVDGDTDTDSDSDSDSDADADADADSDSDTDTETETEDTEALADLLNICTVIEAQIVGNWKLITVDNNGIITTVNFDIEQTKEKGICTWVTEHTMNSDNTYYSNVLPMETNNMVYSKVWIDEQGLLNVGSEGNGDELFTSQYERIQ